MKKTNYVVILCILLAASVIFTGCSSSKSSTPEASAAPEKGSIKINYSTWASDGEASYEGMKLFKKIVEEKSEGVIVVNLFPSNQAGKTEEQFEQVSMNTLQMMSSGNPGSQKLEYLSLPYLMDNNAQFSAVINSEIGKKFNQEIIDEKGVFNIDILPRTPRIVSCNNKVNVPADFKGMKIRVPERDYYVKTFEAFGANPTPMDMGEVYSAIQTGVVSGQENPIETIVSYGFQNICDYLIITNHIVKPAFVAINNDFYKSLSPEYQQLITEACKEAREYAEKYMNEQMSNYYKTCTDAGMTIIEPDLTPFKEATQGVRDELGVKAWGEDGYKQILEIIANN